MLPSEELKERTRLAKLIIRKAKELTEAGYGQLEIHCVDVTQEEKFKKEKVS